MKLIVTGATGFVGSEVVRQALLRPDISSVVAVARSKVAPSEGTPAGATSKLKSVVVKDYGEYPEDAMNEFKGADACIWTVAITPGKARSHPVSYVQTVNNDWTLAGANALLNANPSPPKPIRFMYTSGLGVYDPDKPHPKDYQGWVPPPMKAYLESRGKTQTSLESLSASNPSLQICTTKPSNITYAGTPLLRRITDSLVSLVGIGSVDVADVAACMIDLCVREEGFEGFDGVVTNAEMVGWREKHGKK